MIHPRTVSRRRQLLPVVALIVTFVLIVESLASCTLATDINRQRCGAGVHFLHLHHHRSAARPRRAFESSVPKSTSERPSRTACGVRDCDAGCAVVEQLVHTRTTKTPTISREAWCTPVLFCSTPLGAASAVRNLAIRWRWYQR